MIGVFFKRQVGAMITIKIQCGCGQKYAFDVEPAEGGMSAPVACPVCGLDGTAVANQVIAQSLEAVAVPAAPGLRLHSPVPPAAPSLPAAPVSSQSPRSRLPATSESDGEGEKWKWWYFVLGGICIGGHAIWLAYDRESIKPLGELFPAVLCIAVGIWDFQRKRKK